MVGTRVPHDRTDRGTTMADGEVATPIARLAVLGGAAGAAAGDQALALLPV